MSDYIGETIEKDFERIQKMKEDKESKEIEEFDLSNPFAFVEKYITLPRGTKPEQTSWFANRPYLKDIYNDPSRRVVIVKGRQMEMSEFIVNMLIYNALKYPGVHTYSSATDEKVRRFSVDRLRVQIQRSPAIAPLLKESEVHRIVLGNSIIYLATAQNEFRALLGIHRSESLFLDEFQDTQGDALPMAEELLSHSDLKRMWVIGTPRLMGSQFYKYWEKSDKLEWSKDTGTWAVSNPHLNPMFRGYHISQNMALGLFMTQKDIDDKEKEYPRQKFVNEVKGEFYTGLGRPLTEDMIETIFDHSLEKGSYNRGDILIGGIDWGQGKADTVYTITRPVMIQPPDVFRYDIVFMEKILANDATGQVERARQISTTYPVRLIAGDFGGGFHQNSEMWKILGNKYIMISSLARPEKPFELKPTGYAYMLQVDSTYSMDRTIDIVSKGITRTRIYYDPSESFRDWLIKSFTANYPEVTEKTGQKIWMKDSTANDDAFRSFVFTVMAFDLLRNSKTESGSEYVRFI